MDRAEQLWGDEDRDIFLASLYKNRATCNRFLGLTTESLADSKRAYEIAPDDADCCLAYALELDFSGQNADSVKVIEEALKKAPTPRARLLLAVKLVEQNKPAETKLAVDSLYAAMREVRDMAVGYRSDWFWILIAGLCGLGDLARAREALTVAQHEGIGPLALAVCESVIAKAGGEVQREATILDRALTLVSSGEHHIDLQHLCERLEEAGRWGDALTVYKTFCRTDRLTIHTRAMLACAQHAGEHAFVMATLESLRLSGQTDTHLLRIEGQLCEEYREFDRLRDVLMAGSAAQPKSILWKLRLSHLSLDRGKPEWMPTDLSWIPEARDASSDQGAMVASLFARTGAEPQPVPPSRQTPLTSSLPNPRFGIRGQPAIASPDHSDF